MRTSPDSAGGLWDRQYSRAGLAALLAVPEEALALVRARCGGPPRSSVDGADVYPAAGVIAWLLDVDLSVVSDVARPFAAPERHAA